VDSLNGLRNRPIYLTSKHKADADFFRVLALLREIQDAGAVGMRVEKATNGQPAAVLFFRADRIAPEVQKTITEARQLLGLPEDESKFTLVQTPLRGRPGELGIATRSLSQLMKALSMGVEVPPKYQERKLTPAMSEVLPEQDILLHVHSGSKKPADTFVAVPYEGEWFWIANDDWVSKRIFTSILFMFTLVDTGSAQSQSTLTIPVQ